ncbi:MAG: Fis family transcriptional regulator, partial [Sideroxyarcus sp.]|nr:Fis family transcriptional regulator [Sideroxyarcus sp.]
MTEDCGINENDIARHVRKALNDYFKDLDGEEPCCGMYNMVMGCVEKPL